MEEGNLQTQVMVTMFSLFAEIERELISMHTKEGLAVATPQQPSRNSLRYTLGQGLRDLCEKNDDNRCEYW